MASLRPPRPDSASRHSQCCAPGSVRSSAASLPYRCSPGGSASGRPGCGAQQRQLRRHAARATRQQAARHGAVQHVLGHRAIGRPLAAGDRDQARAADDDGVLAGHGLRVLAVLARGLDQRPQADPHRPHVAALRCTQQVAPGLLQDEVHLLRKGAGLARQVVARRVGGAEDGLAEPGHGEHHAAVLGLGHQQRVVAGQEAAVDDEVHTLARRHHRWPATARLRRGPCRAPHPPRRRWR